MRRRALFIDRDGTLVHARHYPSRREDLVLYDGVAEALRPFQVAGFRLVVVTNQSGIARGLFTEADLSAMHDHLASQLAAAEVTIDGFYHCPHHPDGVIPELAVACGCRKPEPGMILRASEDLGIDPTASWFIGDILADIEAGTRAGCRTVLVDLGTEPPPADPCQTPTAVARDTVHALAIIASAEGLGSEAGSSYVPDRWARPAQAIGDANAV